MGSRPAKSSSTQTADSAGGDASEADSLLREMAELPEVPPPESEPDRTGQRLAHFRIRSKLGQGGMGIVYAAEDLKLRRKVALKVLPVALVANEERRRRFLREARSASAVLHPNIATVFDVGESEGTVFLAMEQVEGVTLRKLLQDQGGRLDPVEAVRIVREVARGLGKAHAAGVVHRDLKPENVMIAADGPVKVLDFGLAKLTEMPDAGGEADTVPIEADDLASRVGKIMGTPGYMSPEQAMGATVDARTDVFSLGVILYEMLTGVRPFRGRTTRELLRAIEVEAPRSVRAVVPAVPGPLARVLDRCLQKRPEERFADCGSLLVELDRVHEVISRRSALTPARVAVAGLVALLLGGGAWLALRGAAPPTPTMEPARPIVTAAVAPPTAHPTETAAAAAPTERTATSPSSTVTARATAKPVPRKPANQPDPLGQQK